MTFSAFDILRLSLYNFFIVKRFVLLKRIYKYKVGGEAVAGEKGLIQRAKRGDRKAAGALVELYYNEIYVFSYRQTGDKQLAMDLTQDIFLSVLQSIGGYRAEKGGFRTWLYRVATNKIIDYRRRVKPAPLSMETLENTAHAWHVLKEKGFAAEIEDYISRQDTDKQRVLRLHIYGGYSFPEIAVLLCEPQAAVKTRYYRFIEQIRREFLKDDSDAK